MSEPLPTGMIFTFYSFKGGVGRSMTLANVAAWLSKWGQRVLIVDWDLEAPGIEKYFQPWLRGSTKQTDGIVELIHSFKSGEEPNWHQCLLHADLPKAKQVDFICAGRDDANYVTQLRALDWEDLFTNSSFGKYLENLRREWAAEYDFVLIDSRTGVTDIGGICTIHLPDVVVVMFTANDQSLIGARKVLQSARAGHNKLPVDRLRLLVVPVPARDESTSEYELAEKWRRERFATELSEFFDDWVPSDESPATVLNYLKIPYFAYWSFGERIPVLEQEDPDNPKTLAYAYQPLAKLILSRMNWKEAREGVRASEEAQRQAAEAERARLQAAQIAEEAKRRETSRRAEESKKEELQKRIEQYIATRVRNQRDYRDAVSLRDQRRISALMAAFILSVVLFLGFAYLTFFYAANRTVWAISSVLAFAGSGLCLTSIWNLRARTDRNGEVARKLEREEAVFRAGGPPYASVNQEQAFSSLVTKVEAILDQDQKDSADEQVDTLPPSRDQKAQEIIRQPSDPTKKGLESTRPEPFVSEVTRRTDGYLYDVFISFRSQALINEWITKEFLPLLSFWLHEELGRPPQVFIDSTSGVASESAWSANTARSLQASKCLLPILTPSYFQSPLCLSHWQTFTRRARDVGLEAGGLIVPLVVHGGETFPAEARNIQWSDFRDFFVVGEGFRQTESYIAFQQQVKALSAAMANRIHQAPPFDPDFVLVTPNEVEVDKLVGDRSVPRCG
jgi:MinD-like ATPase involved in chromosome partitioning or flagellar assembly